MSAPLVRSRALDSDRKPGREAEGDCRPAPQLRLTPRQLEVLTLLCEGLPNKLICRRLDIAMGTVKVHISSILWELGVSSRLEAVVKARSLGIGCQLPGRSMVAESVPAGPATSALHGEGHEPGRRISAAA